jgi:hypothetical protein
MQRAIAAVELAIDALPDRDRLVVLNNALRAALEAAARRPIAFREALRATLEIDDAPRKRQNAYR